MLNFWKSQLALIHHLKSVKTTDCPLVKPYLQQDFFQAVAKLVRKFGALSIGFVSSPGACPSWC